MKDLLMFNHICINTVGSRPHILVKVIFSKMNPVFYSALMFLLIVVNGVEPLPQSTSQARSSRYRRGMPAQFSHEIRALGVQRRTRPPPYSGSSGAPLAERATDLGRHVCNHPGQVPPLLLVLGLILAALPALAIMVTQKASQPRPLWAVYWQACYSPDWSYLASGWAPYAIGTPGW